MKGKLIKAANAVKNLLKPKRFRIIEYVAIIICLSTLFTGIAYSWLKRSWTPKIYSNNLRVQASEALVISLLGSGNGSSVQQKDLMEILGLTQDIILTPVSNYSGESDTFFYLNTADLNEEYYELITADGVSWTNTSINYGYVEVSFDLSARDIVGEGESGLVKYVYLSDDSHIWYNEDEDLTTDQMRAALALRCSLTIQLSGSTTKVTRIFVPTYDDDMDDDSTNDTVYGKYSEDLEIYSRRHYSLNPINDGDVYYIDGQYYRYSAYNDTDCQEYLDYDVDAAAIKRATMFWYDTDGDGDVDEEEIYDVAAENSTNIYVMDEFLMPEDPEDPDTTPLCIMTSGQTAHVTLRLWLEGEDPACVASISGSVLDFLIGFDCENVSEE